MERLTEEIKDRRNGKVLAHRIVGGKQIAAANKLAEYEIAEEQGLLLRLPCKVGDRFWELNTANGVPHIYPRLAHSLQHCVYVLERLGKYTFLTKEEAEQKLAEMGGE